MALTDKTFDENQMKSDKTVNSSVEEEKVLNEDAGQKSDDIYDGVIDLTSTRKKRFHVNRGNGNDGVLELNTSDMSIITRLEQLYPKLQKLSQEASLKQINLEDSSDERSTAKISQALTKIDMSMRQIIDEIFESNVSEVCAPSGSMFDPFNGEFRFEHIIDVISKLYENNINTEFKKMAEKLKKKTFKYTKGK